MQLKAIFVAATMAFAVAAWSSQTDTPLPPHWQLESSGGTSYAGKLDMKTALSAQGAPSLQYLDGDISEGWGDLHQTISARNYAGKRVRFSAMLKTEDVLGWGGLWLRADNHQGKTVVFDNMYTRGLKNSNDWQRRDVVLDIPADAESLHFGLLLAGKGRIWMDQLVFEVVDRHTPQTLCCGKPLVQHKPDGTLQTLAPDEPTL